MFPAVLMAVVSLFIRRSSYDFHNDFLGLLLSVSLTIVVMQVVKVIHDAIRDQLNIGSEKEKGKGNMDKVKIRS